MKLLKLVIPAALVAMAAIAFADSSSQVTTGKAVAAENTANASNGPSDEALKALIEKRMGDGARIDSVSKTNYSGLYEIHVNGDIMYTDKDAKYVFVGHVVDLETRKDYTAERLTQINRIDFSTLPLDSAIKMVKGNGKRVIAVFEDPNCGYCKRLRRTLATMDNVTVYTFMYNILAADSFTKSKNVWCSPDRAKAWDDWMLKGKAPITAATNCVGDPNDKVLALGQKLHITGTPSIFFTDGTRVPGYMEASALEDKWASLQ